MTIRFTRREALATGAAALSATALPSFAMDDAEPKMIEVQMLNASPDDPKIRQVFYPRIIQANVGDTIKFLSTDRGHNAATSRGMVPEGAEGFKGSINGDVEYVAAQPGIYGIECTPHKTTGMVALLVVEGEGKLDNLEEAQGARQPGKARKVWEEIWAEAEEMGLLSETAMEKTES
ncbi:MAG: plastocyanin/azurin family copper-binding protein [Pseudomonadota bacterium]